MREQPLVSLLGVVASAAGDLGAQLGFCGNSRRMFVLRWQQWPPARSAQISSCLAPSRVQPSELAPQNVWPVCDAALTLQL